MSKWIKAKKVFFINKSDSNDLHLLSKDNNI